MRALACLLSLFAVVASAAAQTPPTADQPATAEERKKTHPDFDRRQVVPFLDATYVAFARANRVDSRNPPNAAASITFEADIVPNFVVRQNFFDVIGNEERNRVGKESKWRWAWSIVAVPMVKLRMFINDPSAPVRTPSYMPKGTGQAFFFKPRERRVDLFGLQATLGHHSNGQDGCLFANQSGPKVGECLPVASVDSSYLEPNRKDGSFSTNYLQLDARFRLIYLEPDARTGERLSDGDVTVGVEVELNPVKFLGGGGIDAELRSRYGGTRASLLAGAARKSVGFCNRLEAKGSLKYIAGRGDNVPALAASIEGQCLFRDTNWGLFARYYGGQDYYNLGFQDDVHRVQVGMTYSQEGFLRFRSK